MLGINEDAYWERVREYAERERSSCDRIERDYLFLDERIEEIEEKNGCSMEELYEGDLIDLIFEEKGILAESAEWDDSMCGIRYSYMTS